ncbi:MAG: hypothetical protein ACRD4M_03755 [Candidatus Acidiferrales bacterium]
MNVRVALQGGLELLGKLDGLPGAVRREAAHKSSQAGLGYLGREMNAGDAGCGQHAREALFGGGGFEWCAVKQELIT